MASRTTSRKQSPNAPSKAGRIPRETPEPVAPDSRLADSLEGGETDFADFEDGEPDWGETMPSDLVPRPDQDD
jgi:hypothetical protein